MVILSVVVPCYNEEDVLPKAVARLRSVRADLIAKRKIDEASRLYFVDDGSRDRTWPMLCEFSRQHPEVVGVKLSANRGHQNALLAGLTHAGGDAVVTIDADMQQDPDAIERMVDAHAQGFEVVFGVRLSRTAEPWTKRVTGDLYYRLMRMMGVDIVANHADYRLMGRRAVEALLEYGEVNLFIRGIIPRLGFRSTTVQYEQFERSAGETKYSMRRMISLAINGITSFSVYPLRVITASGVTIAFGSFLLGLYFLVDRLVFDDFTPGWASTVLPITFLGGVQLLSLGVIGEYIGKIYLETKRRPPFTVEAIVSSGTAPDASPDCSPGAGPGEPVAARQAPSRAVR